MIVGCINMMVYVGFRYEFALGFNAQPNIWFYVSMSLFDMHRY